jgi:tetratricopeptide (TPR) repeat protein
MSWTDDQRASLSLPSVPGERSAFGPRCRNVVAACLLLAVGSTVGIHPALAQVDDAERLEQYLQRLGLVELQMHQLEKMIEQSATGAPRVHWARRLSDLYADELTRNLDQPKRYAEIQQRIQRLLARVPESKTPSLEIMLLQAEYQRAESLINQGESAVDPSEAYGQAAAILQRITPALAAHDRELWGRIETLNRQLNVETNAEKLERGEAELTRLQGVAGRAAYFTGWAHYYRGRLGAQNSVSEYQSGRDVFRRLLGMDAETSYGDLDAESLRLSSPWRARALIGLGLCESGLHDLPASRACFALLDSAGVPSAIRDQTQYWFFQGLIGGGRRQEALEYARQQIDGLSGSASQGKVSFCAAVLRAGARPTGIPSSADRELVSLGKQGLVKLGQTNLLRELVQRFGILSEDATDFFSLWLQGQQLREAADISKQAADYRKAVEILSAALQAPDVRADPVSAERCRVELAWCHYQLEQFTESARYYQQAATGLRGANEADAVDAAWMAFMANRKTTPENARVREAMRESVAWLKREFPQHEYTKRAEFLMLQGESREGSPEEQLAALRAIPADDPNHLAAQLELCRQLQRRWREATASNKDAARKEFVETLEQVLGKETRRLEDARLLALQLMRVEVAMADQPADVISAKSWLRAAGAPASRLTTTDRELVAEYHYRLLQLARAEGDVEGLRAEADWFTVQGAGTRFELPGLITAALQVDRQWGEASEEQRVPLADRGLAIYQRLAILLGDSTEKITSQRNAQVAHSKLAYYAEQLERWEVAEAALERLLAAFPKDKGYLKRAGLATYARQRFDASLDYWRTLLAGVAAGTEEWYEAKYYQLACLRETNRNTAAQVFRQFQLLHPNLGGEGWGSRFQELQRELGVESR